MSRLLDLLSQLNWTQWKVKFCFCCPCEAVVGLASLFYWRVGLGRTSHRSVVIFCTVHTEITLPLDHIDEWLYSAGFQLDLTMTTSDRSIKSTHCTMVNITHTATHGVCVTLWSPFGGRVPHVCSRSLSSFATRTCPQMSLRGHNKFGLRWLSSDINLSILWWNDETFTDLETIILNRADNQMLDWLYSFIMLNITQHMPSLFNSTASLYHIFLHSFVSNVHNPRR